ncbi:MAG: YfhO family protein [Candidatus Gottesmanbacteria bacterium]|nr:YfhO family protein [Candidatus Gottesmanbacteria bacterium]
MRARKILGEPILAIIMLVFAIGFNLWLYRAEPTAKVDPNDNTFQFALVYRTNQMWDFANKTCSGNILTFPICHFSYLADHWVPNWNEGYNLPFYYSHIPQIMIVGSYRLLHSIFSIHPPAGGSLFTYYHFIIYFLLCLFPLSVFLALRVTGVSWITAGFGALLASQISTDGFYGLDPASFLWRGYGLSSQLFAMIWLPLAIAYCWRAFGNKRAIFPAIIFLILTTAGHIGIGIMAFLSLIPLALARPSKKTFMTLGLISSIAIFFLSYWILPAMLSDQYHNFSFWDPIWKFNSYGAKEIITRLGNGALFDFGRLPLYTGLIFIGIFSAGSVTNAFSLLFLFFLLLYFGRTSWGNILNLIPAMKEFHLSRFIVGVHLAGLFLSPIGLTWLISRITSHVSRLVRIPIKFITIIIFIIVIVFVFPTVYRQTIRYANYNETLIAQANGNYAKQSPDVNALVSTLQELGESAPGRVFSGRGGSWGHDFRLAETTMTMYLGNFALPTVLWLPETWSPNGDTEQYFRENKVEDYELYNIRYVATPANLAKENIQPFWKLIKENPSWKLYEVSTSGYFTAGVRPAVVASDKYSFTNVIRLWIQSSDPKNGLYPQLSFDIKKYPVNVGLPNFKMTDDVTFITLDNKIHNVFSEPPRYLANLSPLSNVKITDQTDDTDMIFSAKVSVPDGCTECMVILKQTYHPNWRVTVDGKSVPPIIVFPFFIGIPVNEGTHQIVAAYQPSSTKVFLLWTEFLGLISLFIWFLAKKLENDKKRANAAN